MIYRQHTNFMMGAALATMLIAPVSAVRAQGNRTVTLDAGTVLPVKLRETLGSASSHKGDRFSATLQSDDAARSLRLPIGTTVEGIVSDVKSKEGNQPGVLALHFDRIILPNESSYPIQGALIGLDNKSVTRSGDGRLVANPDHKKKTLLYAGYGAGAGLILGALTKGNTILDTVLGGGLGYLLGSLEKGHGETKDVVLKPNTELGVRLDRSLSFKTAVNSSEDRLDNSSSRRNETDQYDVPNGPDRTSNRDPYDDQAPAASRMISFDASQVLNHFTEIHDNGEPVRVIVNGQPLSFLPGARPFISNGVVMVPVIPILKAEQNRYSYTTTQFTAHGAYETLTGRFGSRDVTGSGTQRYTLPVSLQRRNGTIYVPMQFLALVSGQRLGFDRDSQTVELGNGLSTVSTQR